MKRCSTLLDCSLEQQDGGLTPPSRSTVSPDRVSDPIPPDKRMLHLTPICSFRTKVPRMPDESPPSPGWHDSQKDFGIQWPNRKSKIISNDTPFEVHSRLSEVVDDLLEGVTSGTVIHSRTSKVIDDHSESVTSGMETKPVKTSHSVESQSAPTKFGRCKSLHKSTVVFSEEEWSNVVGSMGLVKSGTEQVYQTYRSVTDTPCPLTFRRGFLKKEGSRKCKAPDFRANTSCKFKSCMCSFVFRVKRLRKDGPVRMTVIRYGSHRHKGRTGRWLRGENRKTASQQTLLIGPHETRTELLNTAPAPELRDGNVSSVPSAHVLSQAAAGQRARKRYSHRPIEDLNIMMRVSKAMDTNSETLKGDIHFIADSPLVVHFCR